MRPFTGDEHFPAEEHNLRQIVFEGCFEKFPTLSSTSSSSRSGQKALQRRFVPSRTLKH
jgi:hypothetical protein